MDLFFKSFFLLPLSLEFIFYLELVWEPGAAQVTNSYSRCLPALLEIMVLAIFSFKSWSFNLESQNNEVLLNSSLQLGLGVRELWSDKQKDRQRLQLYIYRYR